MPGPRGPRPEPAEIKAAKGNPGRRPIGRVPVDAANEGVVNPIGNLKPEQRALWDRFAPDLERMKLLRPTDVAAFQRYVTYLSLWLQAASQVNKRNLVTVTISPHVTMERLNKHLQAMIALDRRLEDLEDRFGMNPSARQRILAQMAQAGAPGAAPVAGPLFGEESDAPPPVGEGPSARGSIVGLLN